jgi:hypothetical protein
MRDECDEVGAQSGQPAQLLDRRAFGLVGADVLHGAAEEAAEERNELDLVGRERAGLPADE